MIFRVFESGTGDELGIVDVTEDEMLEWLYTRGFLDYPEDWYTVTQGAPFADPDEYTVFEIESKAPILHLVPIAS